MSNKTTQPNSTSGRTLSGVVMSDKMDKTVVIKVTRLKKHAKYKKFYKVYSKFKAHDPLNEYHPGDVVVIKEIRPISKDKRWMVVEKVSGPKNQVSE